MYGSGGLNVGPPSGCGGPKSRLAGGDVDQKNERMEEIRMTELMGEGDPLPRGTRQSYVGGRAAGGLLIVVLFASMLWCSRDAEANSVGSSDCVGKKGEIVKVVSGKIKLKDKDSPETRKVEGKELMKGKLMPLCIMDRKRGKYLVEMRDDSNEWWIKNRYVLEANLFPDVDDCPKYAKHKKYAKHNLSLGSLGVSRGSGEDPCK